MIYKGRQREIEINGIKWRALPGVNYKFDYYKVHDLTEKNKGNLSFYRHCILNDLFFLVYFAMGVPGSIRANHPYVIEACKDVESGPSSMTLDLWFREGMKSTIITKCETVQSILKNPEERCVIFSYTKDAARAIMRPIKETFETNQFLKDCFPDVLYQKPQTEAFKWAEDDGIIVRRKGGYSEATLEAHGLLRGMPTGRHYTRRVYDDIMVQDLVGSPEIQGELKDKFDISENLGVEGGVERVIGTTYEYNDVLMYIKDKKDPVSGELLYHTRIKPATHDGSFNGKPVFISQKRLDKLKANPAIYSAQQLLNPTPDELKKLQFKLVKKVSAGELPRHLFRFMCIDPRGTEKKKGTPDDWAIMVFGVEGFREDTGLSRFFILDLIIDVMPFDMALKVIVDMYIRNGRILSVGVEKVGMSTMEIHVASALAARGRTISVENGGLTVLSPSGRTKETRIVDNLVWPINNGMTHYIDTIPDRHVNRLREEMDKFPAWKNDGVDVFAYCYDMLKKYKFGPRRPESTEQPRRRITNYNSATNWMRV